MDVGIKIRYQNVKVAFIVAQTGGCRTPFIPNICVASGSVRMEFNMSNAVGHGLGNYIVSCFIGDSVTFSFLDEYVENKDNHFFSEKLGLPDKFSLPIFKENINGQMKYILKQDVNSVYQATLQNQLCDDHVISSGDYIVFKSVGRESVRLLFIDTSAIVAGYKKYKLPKNTNIFIGRMPINDISFNFTDFMSREKHAAIRIDKDGNAYIEDLKRNIGVYVNGKLTHSMRLNPFDEIYIMGLSIVYTKDFIAVRNFMMESRLQSTSGFTAKTMMEAEHVNPFIRAPRILKSLDNEDIEIDAPPNPPTMDKTPAILVVGPSLTMSLVMVASLGVSISSGLSGGNMSTVISSSIMAAGMLAGTLLWPMLLRSYQERSVKSEDKHRKDRYFSYINGIEKNLSNKVERTVRLLNDSLCPAPTMLCSLLNDSESRLHLWERSFRDTDFLEVRMGKGDRPLNIEIKVPRQGFQLHDDELLALPTLIKEKYNILSDVPLTLNLSDNHTIGVIGDDDNVHSILNEIILNIISLHSYDEVKLAFVVHPNKAMMYDIYKNIPHVWSNDKKIRYFAVYPDEVHTVFNAIDEVVKDRENAQEEDFHSVPYYVLIVTDSYLITKEPLLRYMDDANNKVGITTIYAYGDIALLPRSCEAIIQSDKNRSGYYVKNKNENRFISFTLDFLDENKLKQFALNLSRLNIKRDMRTLGVPDRISFLQMYKVGNAKDLNIERHWDSNNSSKSLAAAIGVMAGGNTFELDIHESYHGCHGLVAGTTGSGKSEFLQAFVLSLAINYSPNEVAFVLVDFKGGDMARPFIEKPFSPALPHLAATISNLSGNILYRALVSFEAEIKSRQRLFNESAATLGIDKLDINSYHKYFKAGKLQTPLPHLIIIIDEFAQLKTQQPEFLTQLVNVAQVGRSLGIHLILATQKPSGVVDPQIWSNSRFKVCLKVADKQDSVDMINKPDAAMIKNPGRLYVQVGYDEIYEYVQSGYSGADYNPTKTYMPEDDITVQMTDSTATPIHSARLDVSSNRTDKTQLEAVVAEIVSIGKRKHLSVKPLWLDMLSDKIILDSLAKGRKGICTATVGLVDYVRTQTQKPLTFDMSKTGHIGIYGASGTGKTTFLHTLIYSLVCDYGYTPDELNIYVMDFGGRSLGYLNILPHTGGVVFSDGEEHIAGLSTILHEIINERKRLFASYNCGNYVDFKATSKQTLPVILVLIDNFASFHEKYFDLSESFFDVVSSGKTFGMYFVITGNTRNSIYYKVTEHISTYFTYRMNDPSNYLDIHNIRPPIIPEDINGRGITVINKEIVEFQTALALEAENEADRISSISERYKVIASSWKGQLPVHVADMVVDKDDSLLPSTYNMETSQENIPDAIQDVWDNLLIGVSKTGALKYGINLLSSYKLGVCADDMSAMGECYRNIIKNITSFENRRVVFIDDDSATFESIAKGGAKCIYINSVAGIDDFINDIKPELNERLSEENARVEQMFIIIAEYNRFFTMITDEQAVFMRKVLKYIDSPKYGIIFICGFDVNGEKSNDGLFVSLLVNTDNHLICPYSYEKASSKIETLPIISDLKQNNCYLCVDNKNVAIRW